MKTSLCLVSASMVLALSAIPVANAQNPAACQTVEFSAEVVARFPNIRQVCLDVITRDGEQYAVVKGNLVRNRPTGVTMRMKLPDGTLADPIFIKADPDRRVMVQGQSARVSELAVGQEITTYVKVTEPVMALEAPAGEPLDTAPIAEEPAPEPAVAATAEEPSMPTTASPLPAIGLAGLLLVLTGGVLAFARRRLARS